MLASSDHEQLEPPSRKQEDARGLNVPECPDYGRQGTQYHILHTWLLLQPVSVNLVNPFRALEMEESLAEPRQVVS